MKNTSQLLLDDPILCMPRNELRVLVREEQSSKQSKLVGGELGQPSQQPLPPQREHGLTTASAGLRKKYGSVDSCVASKEMLVCVALWIDDSRFAACALV